MQAGQATMRRRRGAVREGHAPLRGERWSLCGRNGSDRQARGGRSLGRCRRGLVRGNAGGAGATAAGRNGPLQGLATKGGGAPKGCAAKCEPGNTGKEGGRVLSESPSSRSRMTGGRKPCSSMKVGNCAESLGITFEVDPKMSEG